MSRLTKIEGEFMGVAFEVKPTPLFVDKIEQQAKDMVIEWYQENEPDFVDEVKNGLVFDEDQDPDEAMDKIKKMNAWKHDEDFRAKFLRFKAESCMDFKGKVPESVWRDEQIEVSTIQEAWDFFCGVRTIPQDGLRAR